MLVFIEGRTPKNLAPAEPQCWATKEKREGINEAVYHSFRSYRVGWINPDAACSNLCDIQQFGAGDSKKRSRKFRI
jgi:hypothetical protein